MIFNQEDGRLLQHSSLDKFRLHLWKRPIWHKLLIFSLCASVASIAKAAPISVAYTVTHITGTEWQYNYELAGSYASGDDMAVYFPLATSSNLVDLVTGGPDWTTFVFQPDPSLPADGEYDMVANLDNPSLIPVFSVQFQYLGSGIPGSQSFVLFDPSFNILDAGSTIPEPATLLLLGTGMLGLGLIGSREPLKRERRFLRFGQNKTIGCLKQ